MLSAGRARRAAVAAGGAAALGAAALTVLAEGGLAPLARAALVLLGELAAISARDPFPPIEREESALGVVGGEGLGDDREEVEDPPAAERRPDRCAGLPLAEPLVAHMGVSQRRVAAGVALVDGADEVGRRAGSEAPPRKHDLEPAQVDPFQDDRPGDDRDRPFAEVDLQLCKLSGERREVVVEVSLRRGVATDGAGQLALELVEAPPKVGERAAEPVAEGPFRRGPAALLSDGQELVKTLTMLPRALRQRIELGSRGGQFGREAAGGADQVSAGRGRHGGGS